MLRRPFTIALFVLISLAISSVPGLAQTPQPSLIPELTEMPGLQNAVVRSWGIDYPAIIAATPDYQPSVLGDELTTLVGFVLEFDSSDNASNAYTAFTSAIAAELGTMSMGENDTITEEPIADLGDQATVATLVTTTEEYNAAVRYVMVQEGSNFFIAMVIANSAETAQPGNDLAAYLVNEGEPSDDEPAFDPTGLSTGGIWGYFPNRDNPLLSGLTPISDEVQFADSVGSGIRPVRI